MLFVLFRIFKTGLLLFLPIIAGAISNIFDRVVYKGVIDFIVVYFDFSKITILKSIGRINFPIFNFADMFIFLGVVFIMINLWRENK